MNVVFISPHYPPSYRHFCAALKARGAKVLGIGDVHWDALGEVRSSLDDYVHVPHMEQGDALWRAMGLLIHRHGRVDHLDSLNEHWLALEAQLREDFNIVGLRPNELVPMRAKSSMAEVFSRAGIEGPKTLRVEDAASVRAFVKKVGLPVIFKPDVGVGAQNAFRVDDQDGLDQTLAKLPVGSVVQPFVKGRMTTFDGVTDRNGEVRFTISFEYQQAALEMLTDRREVVYWSRREIPRALDEIGRKLVRAFGLRGRFFHLELFERDDGSFVPLEINIRPPGGFTLDLMNYTCDLDVFGLWADVVTGRDLSGVKYEHRYHAAHVGRRNVPYKLPRQEVAKTLGPALMADLDVPGVIGETMGNPTFLIRHADRTELQRLIGLLVERG
jgi:hypothetical protein